jgi:Glycosyl hydrolase family 26
MTRLHPHRKLFPWSAALLVAGALALGSVNVLAFGHAAPVSPSPEARGPQGAPILFGAYVASKGPHDALDALDTFETRIGRPLAIYHSYHAWKGPLIGDLEQQAAQTGHTLLINWKAVRPTHAGSSSGSAGGYLRWRSIADGDRDNQIRTKARELKAFGQPIYLAFHHEPENDRDVGSDEKCGSPKRYIKAFRHVHDLFEEVGATNVKFVWILMGSTFRRGEADLWYPGDDVVDVVGADAYNWFGTGHAGASTWTTFQTAFQPAYDWATARGKPLWVTETGTLEDPSDPSRKAQWYTDMGTQAQAWPNLRAIIYFTGAKYGWWPNSSHQSFAAFRNVVQSPYFGGPGATP